MTVKTPFVTFYQMFIGLDITFTSIKTIHYESTK
ncbi:hypothetical protein MCEGE10_02952 [Flavobacteriaceae bacterium]